jgi:hypothetical protein
MNYSRPEMLPGSFTGVNGIPDLTVPGSSYAVSGNRAAMMQMMFNLDQLTIRARWSLSYSFPPSPTLFYSSFDYTLDCKNLPTTLPCQTSYGYYYSLTTASPPYPVWPDPASRVLKGGGTGTPLPYASVTYDVVNNKSLSARFVPSFTGVAPSTSALQVGCEIIANDYNQGIGANMTGAGGVTILATTALSLYGMSFPIYLAINSGGPVSATFSTPFTVTGSIAFHS